ncbi:flavoprotein [Streptomyces oceani]|uniref:Flavoprotein n=1 Tax=Streptomyces oceani TaxID=1075402 RepID=A0A1E7KJZ7_9ACTN|nr:flavoprotein [Streptomyces oceani]OEV04167.1 flavoprotein [Streptomyces oceani]
MTPVLYLIACAAGPSQYLDLGVRLAQGRGWNVCAILSPSAATWWEPRMSELEDLTGHPVRSQYKLPWQSDVLPKADAMLVAPLSCTSLNKWGAGIADTVALGIPSEAVHMGVPVAVMPFFNQAQAAQPAVLRSVEALRVQGVRVLLGEDGYEPHPPKTGRAAEFPWARALDAVRDMFARQEADSER